VTASAAASVLTDDPPARGGRDAAAPAGARVAASTATIFMSGAWLLLLGHHSDFVLALHSVAFIVWSGVFGARFLAYGPRRHLP